MKKQSVIQIHRVCRACRKHSLNFLFSLGMTPLANAFLTREKLNKPELFFPLDLYQCNQCGLVQLGHVVSPEVLFGNYVYVSSTSKVFIEHFALYARQIVKRFRLNRKSFVVDIGSNDGILLRSCKSLGVRVLGIEPAARIAQEARRNGVPTVSKFFNTNVAKTIVATKGKAMVATANNVFAHIDNLDEVISGIKILLEDHGVFIIEAPYLGDFLQKNYFDLVYHEHLSYLSIRPLQALFDRFSMQIFDVQKVPVHGGSVRVFVKNIKGSQQIRPSVAEFIKKEQEMKLYDAETWKSFARKILLNKAALIRLLSRFKSAGSMIAGYGAPAKGNTLLNYFGIGKEMLDFIVDDSSWKQDLFTPGTHIGVVSSDTLYQKRPDYLLILAWNFAPSIMHMHKRYHDEGGRFIIPVPKPHVVQTI